MDRYLFEEIIINLEKRKQKIEKMKRFKNLIKF